MGHTVSNKLDLVLQERGFERSFSMLFGVEESLLTRHQGAVAGLVFGVLAAGYLSSAGVLASPPGIVEAGSGELTVIKIRTTATFRK